MALTYRCLGRNSRVHSAVPSVSYRPEAIAHPHQLGVKFSLTSIATDVRQLRVGLLDDLTSQTQFMKNSSKYLPTHVGPAGLTEFASDCASALLAGVQHEFKYPASCSLTNWPSPEIKSTNETFLKSLRGRGNVYAIYVRGPKQREWVPVYVGQRKSASLRERISHHLIKKNEATGSMLAAVQTAVAAGEEIGLSFIKVEPESLRLFVEESIIASNKIQLHWNTHG